MDQWFLRNHIFDTLLVFPSYPLTSPSIRDEPRQYEIDWVALSNGSNLVKIGPVVTEILAFEERYGRAGPAHTNIQSSLAQIFSRTEWWCYISLNREFNSASFDMCPLLLRQMEVGKNCRKLLKTFENVLSCNEHMRMRDAKFTTVFVIPVTDLIKSKNGAS